MAVKWESLAFRRLESPAMKVISMDLRLGKTTR